MTFTTKNETQKNNIEETANDLSDNISDIYHDIEDSISDHQDTTKDNAETLASEAGNEAEKFGSSVKDTAEQEINNFIDNVDEWVEKHNFKQAGSIGFAKNDIEDKANDLSDNISDVYHDVEDAISDHQDETKDNAEALASEAGDEAENFGSSVKDTAEQEINNLIDNVDEWAKEHDFKQAGSIGFDKNDIEDKANDLSDNMSDAYHDVEEAISDHQGEVKDDAESLAQDIAEEAENFGSSAEDTVKQEVHNLAEKVNDWTETQEEKDTNTVQEVKDDVSGVWADVWNNIEENYNSLYNAVSDFMGNSKDVISEEFDSVVTTSAEASESVKDLFIASPEKDSESIELSDCVSKDDGSIFQVSIASMPAQGTECSTTPPPTNVEFSNEDLPPVLPDML
tara:strand:+ start:110203 stop:111393 length:1191 start_codon:yes stop_codon:yes gene_type:complete